MRLPHTKHSYAAYLKAQAEAAAIREKDAGPEAPACSDEAATYLNACIAGAGKTNDIEPSIETQIANETRDRMHERARQGRL